MLRVEELIGNLLLRHNCVIVPSFGGFVAKQASATIDYKNGVMLPPRKSILFNRQLINNDGLLISEFAVSNKVFYSSAEESVKNSVSDWNEKLRNGERVTLDRVGHLFYDQEKNICFEQDRFFNLLLESYGLGKVHFVSEDDIQIVQHITENTPLHKEDQYEAPTFQLVSLPTIDIAESTNKDAIIIEHPEVRASSKIWKYIAVAVLLPIGFYSFWIPMKTNVLESGVLSIKDFNLNYKALEGSYEKSAFVDAKFEKQTKSTLEESINNLPEEISVYSFSYDNELYIPVRIKENGNSNTETSVKIESVTVEPEKIIKNAPVKTGSFDFIVNCFANEENAKSFVSELKNKGIGGYVLNDNSGLFRVSAGNASSTAEINTIAEKSKSSGFQGWILKK